MIDWKENKLIAIVAGIVLLISIIITIKVLTTKRAPAAQETPFKPLIP
ncbi:MAG: hypothetical protein ABIG46_03435 [Candidatus Omnitrophota bacterium]